MKLVGQSLTLFVLFAVSCTTASAGETIAATDWRLPQACDVQLGGPLGEAYRRGVERLGEDPYRSVPYLRSDVSFEVDRIFTNYSGDISGRFLEIATLTSRDGLQPPTLGELLRDFTRYQKADGHFGRDVDWNQPLEPENPKAVLLPIFWGNSRLLVGLLEAHRATGKPEFLAAARRIGDFYIATSGRFLDPAREAEYRMTGSYAAGYVTDYFPAIEGLVRLAKAAGDERYLRQAERMAAFFERFDTLPIDHSHANLITHYGLLLLSEATGKREYLARVEKRWQDAVDGGYVWPLGGVGEKFRASHQTDEGCSEADWLRLNLHLARVTGQPRYLAMAERLVRNHYAMNRTANGGYGHHTFVCDADGPLLMQPQFTEAVWCCTFHGLLGLHTLKQFVVVGSPRGVFVNFPLDAAASVQAGDGVWKTTVACRQTDDSLTCRVRIESSDGRRDPPPVYLRRPDYAEKVAAVDVRGQECEILQTKEGYLRLPVQPGPAGEIAVTFSYAPRLENRRMKRIVPDASAARLSGVVLCNGPDVLMASAEKPRPTIRLSLGRDGRLVLEKTGKERFTLATEAPGQTLRLAPWSELRRDAPVAFVFDAIVSPAKQP